MTHPPVAASPTALGPRVVGAAVVGHAVGAIVGVVMLAGPAGGWSTEVGLLLVHVVADVGAVTGAVRVVGRSRGRGWWRPVAVVLVGLAASVLVLWGPGPTAPWLLVRAAVVLAVTASLALVGRPRAVG